MSSIGLYIHWPFCLSKCPYCDFNSHVRDSFDEDAWLNGLIHELNRYAALTNYNDIKTIFFGGGTPSLMHPKTVERIITHAFDLWKPDPEIEITLEANPNSVEVAKFTDLKSAGINRVSIGIQSLRIQDLKALGRKHSVDEGRSAIDIARKTFDRYSFDLIYAREGQKLNDWEAELNEALQLAGTHLSLYQLTIEPGTLFEKKFNRGELLLPSDQQAFDFYQTTNNIMEHHGFHHYEVSNYAKPGYESQHNLRYWRYQDFIGVGPGAHGRITKSGDLYATRQIKAPESWLNSIKNNHHAEAEQIKLSKQEAFEEKVMMGLRISEGVDLASSIHKFPINRLNALIENGYLRKENSKIIATNSGRLILNSLIGNLLA